MCSGGTNIVPPFAYCLGHHATRKAPDGTLATATHVVLYVMNHVRSQQWHRNLRGDYFNAKKRNKKAGKPTQNHLVDSFSNHALFYYEQPYMIPLDHTVQYSHTT